MLNVCQVGELIFVIINGGLGKSSGFWFFIEIVDSKVIGNFGLQLVQMQQIESSVFFVEVVQDGFREVFVFVVIVVVCISIVYYVYILLLIIDFVM